MYANVITKVTQYDFTLIQFPVEIVPGTTKTVQNRSS
jgi:hypothetical protein